MRFCNKKLESCVIILLVSTLACQVITSKSRKESKKPRQSTVFVTSYISDRHGNKINDDVKHFLSRIHRESSNIDSMIKESNNQTKTLKKLFLSLVMHFENEEKLIVIELETKRRSNFMAQFKRRRMKQSTSHCGYYGQIVGNKKSRASVNFCDGLNGFLDDGENYDVIESLGKRLTRKQRASLQRRSLTVEQLRDFPKIQSKMNKTIRSQKTSPLPTINIGVLVGLDDDVVKFHGRDRIYGYITTLFQIVNKIFHHSSLGVAVNIILTHLEIVDAEKSQQLMIANNPSKTFSNVCRWRNQLHSPSGDDVTIYLSRHFKGPDYTGYTRHHSICSRKHTCAIIQENGFSRAVDIAHEIGHTLGLRHDEMKANCRLQFANIMNGQTHANTKKYYWSKCSRHRIKKKLRKGHYYCLNDVPMTSSTLRESFLNPGSLYSIDEQCQLEFGDNFRHPTTNFNFCNQLICFDVRHPNRYMTRREAAMDSTPCNGNRWCWNGQCVIRTTSKQNF